MGLISKPAFSAGELDPRLWERTNLDKYRNGLATARNVCISKTGSLLSAPGRANLVKTKLNNFSAALYSPPGGGVLLEWGNLYVRIYSIALTGFAFGTMVAEVAHPYLSTDIPNLTFETSGSYVYIFCPGKNVLKLNYANGAFVAQGSIFAVPPPPSAASNTPAGTPAGYGVEYAITYVFKGEESLPYYLTASFLLPIAAGQTNTISSTLSPNAPGTNPNPNITEMRLYRRPQAAGAYGYIGSGTKFVTGTGNIVGSVVDLGQDADYTHSPPQSLMPNDPNSVPPQLVTPDNPLDPGTLLSPTGIIYQQRLIVADGVTDLQALYGSQPGFQDNFYRNFPIDAASALKFKCGTSGYARVHRMVDSDGLVVGTAAGIYLNQGELGPDNISFVKKAKYIVNPQLPMLALPGGIILNDLMTNGVRNLLWSFQLNGFDGDEVSIYSDHLFRTNTINAWCFQQGYTPLLWATFSNGVSASFTYDYNQQMQAWTRHDGVLPTAYVCGTTVADQTFFLVTKVVGGVIQQYIEYTLPRFVPPAVFQQDPDSDKNPSCAYMHGITSKTGVLSIIGNVYDFQTTTLNDEGDPDWSGPINVNSGLTNIFAGVVVNDILRFFDEDKSAIDLKVTVKTDSNNIAVTPDNVKYFPSNWATLNANTGPRLYKTFTTITGLDYLNEEYPSVIVDGSVVCSPNNDQENYHEIQVLNGTLTLPHPAAIAHVGRPIIGDVETLDIDTVEQSPTLVESITVNKIYIKVKDSRGLYVGTKFPEKYTDEFGNETQSSNGVTDMTLLDTLPIDYSKDHPIIGNRAQPSQTRRYEITQPGDYSRQGKICVRQVDPLHFEILSFIPDVEVLKREDR